MTLSSLNWLRALLFCLSTLSILGTVSLSHAQQDTTVSEYEFSQAELDQILAPIALYPDTVLSHILIAATYPLEVVQADRWLTNNAELETEAAISAAEKKDWDPSVKALIPFPNILQRMSEDLEWMQKLGDAFLQNEELVLASIQDLRQRAYEEGNLGDLDHLEVSHEDEQIIIEPATREVVYIPYYDTRLVYGSWWWNDYPPIYWPHHRRHYVGTGFYWGPRVYVGSHIYFSSFHWYNRRVVVVDHRHHHRHRFYTGRHVARHSDARAWVHNTRHRRGVAYRNPLIQHRAAPQRSARHARQVADQLQHRQRNDIAVRRTERPAQSSRQVTTRESRNSKWSRPEAARERQRTERQVPNRADTHSRQTRDNRASTNTRREAVVPRETPVLKNERSVPERNALPYRAPRNTERAQSNASRESRHTRNNSNRQRSSSNRHPRQKSSRER